MRRHIAVISVLIVTALSAPAFADSRTDRMIRDLESPYLEIRETAADRLASGGGAGAAALRAAYSGADYRTKELILAAFTRGDPAGGVPLLLGDLGCPDRGVFRAQLGLVSALYALSRNLVATEARRGLPLGDWAFEEGLRALPTRVPAARKSLNRLLAAVSPRLRDLGSRLRKLVNPVDRLRNSLSEARAAGGPKVAERVREIQRHLLRHDVERLLFAVFQAGGREGAYDGMNAVMGELLEIEGRGVYTVLMSILKDRELPEAGVPASTDSIYRFREPPPMDSDIIWIRKRAAYCIGEIGDRQAGLELLEYYESHLKRLTLDPYEGRNPREDVAHACAALGQREPLLEIIEYYVDELRYLDSGDLARLASAYARLEQWEKARARFDEAVELESDGYIYALYNLACVLSRMGHTYDSLGALRRAVENGYGLDPSHLEWLERDGDLAAVRKLDGYRELVGEIRRKLMR